MAFLRRIALGLICVLVILFLSNVSAMRKFVWEPAFLHSESTLFQDASIPAEYMCSLNDTENAIIYCEGKILEIYNMLKITDDSKTFVDRPLKKHPKEVLKNFEQRFGSSNYENIKHDDFKEFLDEFFAKEGDELVDCELLDWVKEPAKISAIKDPIYKAWALDLNEIWKKLCRKMKKEVLENQERFSLIGVNNEFIVPGGRFREFYYWDAYWIVRGLAISGMYDSILLEVSNFAQMIKRFGFVPNGGRNYYLRRSQPPFIIPMAFEYLRVRSNISIVPDLLNELEREVQFWETRRSIEVVSPTTKRKYLVFRYHADSNTPRPESYKEDMSVANKTKNDQEKSQMFTDLASAAESGWDFSSRWFAVPDDILTIETTRIIPVDLNAEICWNYNILTFLFFKHGDFERAKIYQDKQVQLQEAMDDLFYNKTLGSWFDFSLRKKAQNTEQFYLSSAVPLFTKCYNDMDRTIPDRYVDYLKKVGALKFHGGVPTSLYKKPNVKERASEQWDFPNGWSPLNHMIIEGLRKSISRRAQDEAFKLAKKWLRINFLPYARDCVMWEKYDVTGTMGHAGVGGEYDVQAGFGWTNGVALDLLYSYRDQLFFDAPLPLMEARKRCLVSLNMPVGEGGK